MRCSDDRLAIRGVPIAGDTPALQEEGLLDDAEFRAAVFGPSRIGARGIGGHFAAEAHGLNAVALDASIDQSLADGLRTALAEAAVVFLRAALVGEASEDEAVGTSGKGRGDGLDFGGLSWLDAVAVEAEENRRELSFLDIRAHEIRAALKAFAKRCASDKIAVNSSKLIAFFFFLTSGEKSDGGNCG